MMEAIGRAAGFATLAIGGSVLSRDVLRATRRTVAVTDATGPVGSLIVKGLLKDGRFKVRAIVLDPDMYKAQIPGCDEVVAANFTDIASMRLALTGAHFAFLMPRTTSDMDAEQFKKSAKKLADAAKGACLRHSIWYTMEGADSLLGCGPSGLPMLEAEVNVARHVRELGIPITFVAGSFPFEFILDACQRTVDQRSHLLTLPLKSVVVPGVALSDVAKAAADIFSNPSRLKKQTIYLVAEEHTVSAYAETLAKVSGNHVVYNEVSESIFGRVGGPDRRQLLNLCQVVVKHTQHYRLARLAPTPARRKLKTKLVTFEKWLKKNGKQVLASDEWKQLD